MDQVGIRMGFADDEPVTSLSLQKDFGGFLPSVGDYINLSTANNTYEIAVFKVTQRLLVPKKGWSLEVEPTSEEGWIYKRKIIETRYR